MQLDTSENTEYQVKVSPPKLTMVSNNRKLLVIALLISLGAGFSGGFWFAKNQTTNPPIPIFQKLINQNIGQPQEVNFALYEAQKFHHHIRGF